MKKKKADELNSPALIPSKDQAKVVEAANGDPEIEKILASLFTSSYKIPGYWKSKLDGIWYYYFEKGEHEAGLGSCGTWANNMQVEIDKIISPSQAYRPGYNINAGSVGLFPVKKHWWYESHMAIQVKIVKYENCKSSLCFEFYMDDGFLGKDDHIFFPEDIRGRWK